MKTKGFTLIELLVTVTIIVILSTIGVSVFTVAQQHARDGKRKADILSIANSIEASKNYSTGVYTYSGVALGEDFPRGITADTKYAYCIDTNTGLTAITDPSTSGWDEDTCPTGYDVVDTLMAETVFTTATTTTKSWKICAMLEISTPNPYCLTSLTLAP